MTESFIRTPFFRKLRVNPEYGIQKYSMTGFPPDMALPNIMGNFFYRRTFLSENTSSSLYLYFGGVQNSVSVWVNNVYIGCHEGYNTPFEMEIPSDILKAGENEIVLSVSNYRLAGRTNGNLATVVYDHPVVSAIPHDGFCGWQFAGLFDKGSAVCFENDDVTFNPIIEVVSSHKCVLRQVAMFEFTAFRGRCMVCSFDFKENDPAASYLKAGILEYMKSEKFTPSVNYTENMLDKLIHGKLQNITGNVNLAFNPNDKTALVK